METAPKEEPCRELLVAIPIPLPSLDTSRRVGFRLSPGPLHPQGRPW